MPRTSINYKNTIIYKIVCNDLNVNDLYVGHTTDFTRRRASHKLNCNNLGTIESKFKIYNIIRENGNWENWTMIEIEKYPCNDSNEASSRERYWYEILNANLNMRNPHRCKKEWAEDNKEHVKEHKRLYHINNIENIKEKKRQYYLDNKQYIDEKAKQLYTKNKDVIDARRMTSVTCECGINYTISNKKRHYESKKHIDLIKEKILSTII